MFDRLRKWLEGNKAEQKRRDEQAGTQQLLSQIDQLIKLNNLTEKELREQRDTLTCREEELKAQWRTEKDEGRKRDRLIDIKYIRNDKTRIENRLNMLYERGRGVRETRATLHDVSAARIPSLSPEQIDEIRTTAVDAMRELRETQMAFAQLEGATSFASSLDAGLKELESELKGEVEEPREPTPIDAPDYAERELEELKRELEGDASDE